MPAHLDRSVNLRRTVAALPWLCAAALLSACGGGGGSDSGGAASASPTAAAYAAGPITGFGSVIVQGVRFDDSTARVSDDDGGARSRDDLRLGMMAEIQASKITTDSTGSRSIASDIRFGPEMVGPVSAVAADGSSIVVLGETVAIASTTIFDDRLVGGIAALRSSAPVVEVHGLLNVSTGAYTATRIEPKPNAPFYKIRGVVAGLDKTARTFRLGSGTDTVSYDTTVSTVPAALDNGLLVRVRLQTTQAAGRWVAVNVNTGVRQIGDHTEAEIEGTVSATTFAVDKKFAVNGIPVDASGATFPNGSAGIVLGARVEVRGSAVAGTVVATRVSIETERERADRGFELHGAILSLDSGTKTFSLRGLTVNYAGATVEFRKGTVTDLSSGRRVEVKGVRSSDGTTLVAVRITFEG